MIMSVADKSIAFKPEEHQVDRKRVGGSIAQSQLRSTTVLTPTKRREGVHVGQRTLSVARRSGICRRILRVLKKQGVVDLSYLTRKERGNAGDSRSKCDMGEATRVG